GFNVTYRRFKKKPISAYTFELVQPSVNEDGLFSVVLNVAKKSRYEIQVTPYNSEMEAATSDPIYFNVSGVPLGVTARSLRSNYKTNNGKKGTQVTKDVPLRGTPAVPT
ncbi:hypothetical protein EGW08_021905, partial [Elysia chlorotica]